MEAEMDKIEPPMTTEERLAAVLRRVKGEGDNPEEGLVTIGGDDTEETRQVYMDSLADVITPAYTSVVKKHCPWMTGLTVSRDDALEWWAAFDRDGKREQCALGGTTFPQFPGDFVACIKRHLANRVDHSQMEAIAADLEGWASDDDDDDDLVLETP